LLKSRDPHLAGGEKHRATNQTDHTLQNPKQIRVECFSGFGRKENTERCQELDCKEVFGQNLQRSSHGSWLVSNRPEEYGSSGIISSQYGPNRNCVDINTAKRCYSSDKNCFKKKQVFKVRIPPAIMEKKSLDCLTSPQGAPSW
jgi:hypothetical protein